ncbi:MAG: hypothetical protein WD042_07670 [Phycisphaeraceae bacterium]
MIRLGQSASILGLALDERSIHVVEMRRGAARGQASHWHAGVLREARFDLPDGVTWESTVAPHANAGLGSALRDFLRQQGFTTRRAVVGLPGRWLLTRPQTLPPADMATAVPLLRLAIEREFPTDVKEWVCDVAGQPSPSGPRTVLLTAVPRRRLEQVTAAMEQADLDVQSMTSTTLSLLAASAALACGAPGGTGASGATDCIALLILPHGVEVAVLRGGQVVALDRLSVPTPDAPDAAAGPTESARIAAMVAAVRRVLAAVPPAPADGSASSLVIWNASALSEAPLKSLGAQLGIPPGAVHTNPNLAKMLPNLPPGRGTSDAVLFAAAAAVTGARPAQGAAVDFLHSRLAVAAPRRLTRRRVLSAAVAACLILATVWLVGDWYRQKRAVDQLQQRLTQIKPELEAARINVARVRQARGWYDRRPAYLEALRDLTLAFPEGGQAWTSSLALREDMTGTLAGRAADERTVLNLLERCKSSGRFAAVKLLYMRHDDRQNRYVSFGMTFSYLAQE